MNPPNDLRDAMLQEAHRITTEFAGTLTDEERADFIREWHDLTEQMGYEPHDQTLQDAALVVLQMVIGILLVEEVSERDKATLSCLQALTYILSATIIDEGSQP